MRHFSSNSLRRRASVALAAGLVVSLSSALPSSAEEEPTTPPPTSEVAEPVEEVPVPVANPSFSTSTRAWDISSNASLKRVTHSSGATSGRVRPRSSKSTKTIWIRSEPSKALAQGTYVHVAGRVAATQRSKTIAIQLREISPEGRVLRTFNSALRTKDHRLHWLGAHLTTKYPNSRVAVRVKASRVTGKHKLWVREIRQSISPNDQPDAPPDNPNDNPTEPAPTPTPTPTPKPTTAPAECKDINYADPNQGVQTFGDEFNGSSVDTTKWKVRNEDSLSFDKARILGANVTVHDGKLDIAGKRQDASGRAWTTGYIDTMGKFSQKYGRWEMRAKLPTDETKTRGIWPAFWLRGDTTKGEIDVMESYGSPATKTYNPSSSYEWTVWKDTTQATGSDRFHGWGHSQSSAPTPRIYEGYHTYAVNWSPDCMAFSYDGEVKGVVKTTDASWLGPNFDSKFNIRLNMQIGSSYWGYPDDNNTKPLVNYLVDYVRVYAPK